jgi:hypothetical protein
VAGYSGTPLPKKLGIKQGCRVAVLGGPVGFAAALEREHGDDTTAFATSLAGRMPLDAIVLFTKSGANLAKRFSPAAARLTDAGGLWVAWPKKSSGVPTDLDENRIRDIGLAAGLVDNKVCAIDEVWSGLRFVYRVKDRGRR